MLKNVLKISFRNLKREKGYSAINILGLTIGITCSLFLLLYILDELSYDRYHENADNLYRVVLHAQEPESEFSRPIVQIPLADELLEKYSEVENATRFYTIGRELIRQGEKLFYEEDIYFADSTVFDMFSYEFIAGDPNTALDQPNSIVISESMAIKYFDTNDALDKSLTYVDHNQDYKITGIIKDVPKNSHFRFDALMSVSSFPPFNENKVWGRPFAITYVQLPENYNPADFQPNFEKILEEHVNPIFEGKNIKISYDLQPITDIHLYSKIQDETEAGGDISYIYIFSAIAAFMLIIACINYINLATARSVKRAKEVGIRKVMGSLRRQLVLQFITESVLLASIALFISILLIYLLLPAFNYVADKNIILADQLNLNVAMALIAIIVLVGVIGGSYPALYLSRFNPATVLKGNISKKGGNVFIRKALVVLQFSISIFMLIATLVVYDQLNFLREKDLGFDKEHLVRIAIDDGRMRRSLPVLEDKLKSKPAVKEVATASATPGMNVSKGIVNIEDNEGVMAERPTDFFAADYDFINALGMTITEGRNFSRDILSDTLQAALVNEAMVERMNWTDPIGKRFVAGKNVSRQVVGVIQDYHQNSLYNAIEPLVVIFNKNNYYTYIKVQEKDLQVAVAQVEDAWREVFPDKPFEYEFLDQAFDAQYDADERRGTIFTIFSILTVIIACLGLLGLTSFTTEQRAKEISIRKVIGASISNIIVLVSKEFILLVVLATLIAFPVVYYFMDKWLQAFAYRIELKEEILTFILSAALALLITMITVGYHSARAAMANPVNSLKAE